MCGLLTLPLATTCKTDHIEPYAARSVRTPAVRMEGGDAAGLRALLTAALRAPGEHGFYRMFPAAEPPMPAAEEQDRRNSPEQEQQQQQHALDAVRPQQDQKRRSDHHKARRGRTDPAASRSWLRRQTAQDERRDAD